MEEPKRIYTTILIKRRIAGAEGPPENLNHGELGMNEVNNTLYIGTTNTENISSSDVTDMGFV